MVIYQAVNLSLQTQTVHMEAATRSIYEPAPWLNNQD
jgi:hypothetical protein